MFRTAAITPGKDAAVIAFAREVAAYLKSHDIEVEVLRPLAGNPQRIAWFTRYKDFAAWEATRTRHAADPRYQEILAKAAGIFVPGSLNDEYWQTI